MPAVKLTRQEHLASLLWQVDDRVVFEYGDELTSLFFYMDAEAWQDIGQPKSITITIQPGDHLN